MTVLCPLIDMIEFSRYRCFRDLQQVRFGRLTLVYGENNTGKSALVRLPALLADSQGQGYRGLNASSEILRGGSTRDVQWRGHVPSEESPDTSLRIQLSNGASWKWVLRWQDLQRKLEVEILDLAFTDQDGTEKKYDLSPKLNGMLPAAGMSTDTAVQVSELKSIWDHTCWLSTSRVGPSHLGVPVGKTGRLWGDGAMAEADVLSSDELRQAVMKFYEAHTLRSVRPETRGSNVDALVLEPIGEASHTASFKESGSGLEYMFPIVTAAERLRNEGGILIIEEPEAHLHPRLQRALAEHLVGVLAENSRAQIVLETHSEVFLLAALEAALPSDSLGPTDVAIYWTETASDGSAVVERVELDEEGRPKTPRLEQAYDTMGVMRRHILRKRRSHAG